MTATERDAPLPAFLEEAPLTEEQIAAEKEHAGEGPPDAEMPQRWRIEGDRQAEWCLRRLAAVEAEGNAVTEQAEQWSADIERWKEERLRPLESDHNFFTAKLIEYLRALRDADPKVKSRALPSGTIKSRAVAPSVEVVDDEAVIRWARENGHADLVKVAESVRLGELKKVATIDGDGGVARDPDSGQPIPGTMVHGGSVGYSVVVGG